MENSQDNVELFNKYGGGYEGKKQEFFPIYDFLKRLGLTDSIIAPF